MTKGEKKIATLLSYLKDSGFVTDVPFRIYKASPTVTISMELQSPKIEEFTYNKDYINELVDDGYLKVRRIDYNMYNIRVV